MLIRSQIWQMYGQDPTVFIIAAGGTLSCQQLHVSASVLAKFRLYSLLLHSNYTIYSVYIAGDEASFTKRYKIVVF